MIRLVCSQGNIAEDDEYTKYLCSVASRAISEAIEDTCDSVDDTEEFLDAYYGEEFFKGIGKYYASDDRTVGFTIFHKKIDRMLEKLSDTSEVYTFDLIEERIFYDLICELKGKSEINAEMNVVYHNERHECAAKNILMKKFELSEEDAKALTQTLTCVATMDEYDEEENNLFFWDEDYLMYFSNGFTEGIKAIAKAERLGYGYEYAVGMFEDIGMKIPVLLVGSKEANQLEREYVNSDEAIAAKLDDMMNGNE